MFCMPPRHETIYSENASFQQLESLWHNRNKRHKSGRFLIEGVRQINQALAYRWNIRAFLYAQDTRLSDWAQTILDSSTADIHYSLPVALLEKLSRKKKASELIALVEMPSYDLATLALSDLPLIVVLDRPSSPGNLGTLIRSCDALGVDAVIVTGHAVDIYEGETVAASTGSLFALNVLRLPSHNDLNPLIERIRSDYGDVQVLGTSARATELVYEANFWRPTVLLIGNETEGLIRAYEAMADKLLSIPMQGSASSLNVAVAASVVLYEASRQRSR